MLKNIKRIIALGLVISISVTGVKSYAQSLSEAVEKKTELVNSLNEANALVKNLSESKKSIEEKLDELKSQISAVEKRGEEIQREIEETNTEILSLEQEIKEKKEAAEKKKKDMALRIVYSYENGRNNLLDALLSAGSMGEFLNIMQFSIDLARYDQEVLDDYEEILQILSKEEAALSQKQENAQRLAEENEEAKASALVLKAAEEKEVAKLNGEIVDAVEVAKIYEEEVKAQEEVLSAIKAAMEAEKRRIEEEKRRIEEEKRRREEEEKRKQEAESNGESAGETPAQTPTPAPAPTPEVETTTGIFAFTWPCPSSRRITSEFGMRESPTAGASTNHKGIDIGAAKGSAIVAADSGKVILSTYSASAGNYIIVSHGADASGKIICSVYMHADTRLVSVGDVVTKGQKIATVGSTGYSTGPHLHFGVTEDGVYVNPWGYVS